MMIYMQTNATGLLPMRSTVRSCISGAQSILAANHDGLWIGWIYPQNVGVRACSWKTTIRNGRGVRIPQGPKTEASIIGSKKLVGMTASVAS
jgi:hypothetical protein